MLPGMPPGKHLLLRFIDARQISFKAGGAAMVFADAGRRYRHGRDMLFPALKCQFSAAGLPHIATASLPGRGWRGELANISAHFGLRRYAALRQRHFDWR